MENYSCPNCREKSISFWQKQFAGPLKKIRCKSCNALISVSWIRSFLVIFFGTFFSWAFAMAIFISMSNLLDINLPLNGLYWALVVGFFLGLVIAIWLYHRFVPLVRKDA